MNQSHSLVKVQAPAEDVVSLSDIFSTLKDFKWSIVSFTLSATIVSTLITFSLAPIYQSTAVIEIEQDQAKKILSIEQIYGVDGGSADSYLNTQYEVLQSRTIMQRVVMDLNLLDNPEFNYSLRDDPWYKKWIDWRHWFGLSLPVSDADDNYDVILNNVINALAKNVNIEPLRKTQIIKINVLSESAALAARIANAIATSYIDLHMEARFSVTTNATSWMQVRLEELSSKLKEAEEALQNYREEENLIEMQGVLTLANNELTALTESLVKERQTLAVTGNVYRQVQNSKSQGRSDFSSLPAVIDHPLIVELKQQESKLERTVEELSRRYGNKHPRMIAANSELESVQKSLRAQIATILASVEAQYRVAQANEASLSKTVEAARAKAQEINRKQFRLQALEREVQTNKDLYDAFFKRIQESNATVDLQTGNARIVDRAYATQMPVKPRKELIIALSTLLGFLLASAIAFLLDMMNNTLRTPKDVEDKINLPVLGALLNVRKKSNAELQQLFNDTTEYSFSESIRNIRTSLTLMSLDSDQKVFAVTSSVAQEGKSTISCNVAFSLGQLGKTLVIGCDMRRPTLARRLGLKRGLMGLSNLLNGSGSVEECIRTVGNIDILPSGIIPPNPQELLASDKFPQLIELLRNQYEYIILDCPPVQYLSDTLTIARSCDGFVYVVEAGRIQIPVVMHCIGRLMQARANIVGVVLNKVDPKRKDVYESNYGYYGYEAYQPTNG